MSCFPIRAVLFFLAENKQDTYMACAALTECTSLTVFKNINNTFQFFPFWRLSLICQISLVFKILVVPKEATRNTLPSLPKRMAYYWW